MEDELDEVFFEKRPTDRIEMIACAYAFATLCQQYKGQPCKLSDYYDQIMRGDPGVPFPCIVFLASTDSQDHSLFKVDDDRALKELIRLPDTSDRNTIRQRERPEYFKTITYGEDKYAASSEVMLICYETYVYGQEWRRRLTLLAAGAQELQVTLNTDRIYDWLIQISQYRDSGELEKSALDIYCTMMIHPTHAMRSTRPAYEIYRNLNKIYPQEGFDDSIEFLAINPPFDLMYDARNNTKAPGPMETRVLLSAALACLKAFMNDICRIPVEIYSQGKPRYNFCPDNCIYIDDDRVYFRANKKLYYVRGSAYEPLVKAYMEKMQEAYPMSVELKDVMASFCAKVDEVLCQPHMRRRARRNV